MIFGARTFFRVGNDAVLDKARPSLSFWQRLRNYWASIQQRETVAKCENCGKGVFQHRESKDKTASGEYCVSCGHCFYFRAAE